MSILSPLSIDFISLPELYQKCSPRTLGRDILVDVLCQRFYNFRGRISLHESSLFHERLFSRMKTVYVYPSKVFSV